ncbi:MAG: hypothetical protein WBH14_00170 [Albidovulum sp.]
MQLDTIKALSSFLQWGAVGLAGLMLVLVIIALITGTFTRSKERTLKFFMTTGAVCFLAALAAEFYAGQGEHQLNVSVLPNDLDTSPFPPPKVRINGVEVNRSEPIVIMSRSTLTIDVTSALGIFSQKEQQVVAQAAEIDAAEKLISEQTETLVEARRVVAQISAEVATIRADVLPTDSPSVMPRIDGIGSGLQSLQNNIGGAIRLAP